MVNGKRRSCDACYKRKIRCEPSDINGLCDWCAHHKIVCVFSKRKQRKSPNDDASKRLAKRLEVVEKELEMVRASRETVQKPPSPATTLHTPQSASSVPATIGSRRCPVCRAHCAPPRPASAPENAMLGQIFFSGHNFGTLCARTGIPHFSSHCEEWIYAQTGEWPRFQFPPFEKPKPVWISHSASSLSELPERWVLDSLFDEYIRSDLYLVFPLVDPILFRETANIAYSNHDTLSLDNISAKACVFAFLAMSSLRFPSNKASAHVDAESYAKLSQIMISEFFEDASLTALQTYLLLFLLETNVGRMHAVIVYHTVACRTVFALGGHLTSFPIVSGRPFTMLEREDRHLRILFWLCYVLEKDIALRTGQPPIINDRFCDLSLPEGWEKTRVSNRRRDPNDDDQMPFLPGDLRLCIIKSKAVDKLYANDSVLKSDAEILRTIRELDEELEEWRSALPAEIAPSLSIRKGMTLSEDLTDCASMLHIELHLEYHHLLNAIHCASRRCAAPSVGDGGPVNYGVQSSLDVSVEASRSTIIYLTAASSRIAAEAFWVFVFYPMSALMTVFFSILRNPGSDHAIEDVELLATSSRIIHSMPMFKVSQSEMAYLQQVDVFVAELCRLAYAAIRKAQ